MLIDLDRYDALAARGLIGQGDWGDDRGRACLMYALVTGATSERDCAAKGWPLWLAEMAVWLFDRYDSGEAVERGRALAQAIHDADARGVDWSSVYRRVRCDAILPIAMDAIGSGDEPWRVACRDVVQWSIDNDGAGAGGAARAAGAVRAAWAAGAAEAAEAAGGAQAAGAADAARAAGSARAADAARAARAAEAAEAARAALAAARQRIEATLIKALR